MDAVSLLFILVFFVWFPIEFVTGDIIPGIRRKGARIKRMDRGSLHVVHLTIYPALIIAFVLAAYNLAMLPDWAYYPELILMAAGIIFRQWAPRAGTLLFGERGRAGRPEGRGYRPLPIYLPSGVHRGTPGISGD